MDPDKKLVRVRCAKTIARKAFSPARYTVTRAKWLKPGSEKKGQSSYRKSSLGRRRLIARMLRRNARSNARYGYRLDRNWAMSGGRVFSHGRGLC